MTQKTPVRTVLVGLSLTLLVVTTAVFVGVRSPANAENAPLQWLHLSTAYENLPTPGESTQQTASLILDVDGDNVNDFVIAARRTGAPAVVWYRRDAAGWTRYVVEAELMDIEAGGAYADIDHDGDLDIVLGGDQRSNHVWWWENPAPNFDPAVGWPRRAIKNEGVGRHHDLIFADFDGDGAQELVFWNQLARTLWLAEVPADPHVDQPWAQHAILTWADGDFMEGLAAADIDGDGREDIVGGGRWFKYVGAERFEPHIIDDAQRFSRVAVGQLVVGGAPEVVFGAGDTIGPLRWYGYDGTSWVGHDLLAEPIDHGHSLAVADLNNDGNLDIFAAEMRLDGSNPDAAMWLLLGDGAGNFAPTQVATGYDNHESTVADLDGDGDLDILGKPYNYGAPRLDIWLNQTICQPIGQHWQRRLIDADAPWRTLFVAAADLDGDGQLDISNGGWWYMRTGSLAEPWARHAFGAPLNNMAALYDFDQDGDVDVFGSQWRDEGGDPALAWARNDGAGVFTPLANLASGEGDFLQGVAVGRWQSDQLEIALSWHRSPGGVQSVFIPTGTVTSEWPLQTLSATSQNEALSAGDIDRDGRLDLLLGTKWLRNLPPDPATAEEDAPSANWQSFTLATNDASPDRNRLVDINQDGRLDAVVGYEAINELGMVAWYAQPEDATAPWSEHLIATRMGPMSLDVVDMDGDGDQDVVVGEHSTEEPLRTSLVWFENLDSLGGAWQQHLVYRGDEHHDGAITVDIDGDGDMDILSIGWTHRQVLLYENVQPACALPDPTATATYTTTVIATGNPAATISPTVTPSGEFAATATLPAATTHTPTPSPTGSFVATTTPPHPEATATPTPTSTNEGEEVELPRPSPTPYTTGALRGIVRTLQEGVLTPVQIDLRIVLSTRTNRGAQLEYAVTTNENGVYRVEEVPVGDYWLTLIPATAFYAGEPLQVTIVTNSVIEVEQIVQQATEFRTFLPAIQNR